MPSKRGLILDAGSGTGIYTIALAKRGYDLILLDYSRENLKANRQEIEKRSKRKDQTSGGRRDN